MILNPTSLESIASSEVVRSKYREAKPFPHVVIDGAFDRDLLRRLADQFPPLDSVAWKSRYETKPESKKHASTSLGDFTPELATALISFNTAYFLNWLERVTGIEGLMPDPYFLGGGLHQVERGGFLKIHTDFNRHPTFRLDRRLNVLIYMNDGWDPAWGGSLDLYEHEPFDGAHPYRPTWIAQSIAPVLGRMVVFSTSPWSFHGHPHPLQCPEGVTRKSIALYYYTNGRPLEERVEQDHSTVFFSEQS